MLPRIFEADTATNHYVNNRPVVRETVIVMESQMEVELEFGDNDVEVEYYEFSNENEKEELIESFETSKCYTEQTE